MLTAEYNSHRKKRENKIKKEIKRGIREANTEDPFELFVSLHKIGSTGDHGATRLAETAGMILFRLILWAAIISAASVAIRPVAIRPAHCDASLRAAGLIFLALVAACTLPYLAGFAYTRHASILIYPAALMCCRILVEDPRGDARGA